LANQWVESMLLPLNPTDERPITVHIPAGASTREAADHLAGRGLIKDAIFFRYYARYRKLDDQIKPGEYELSPAMAPEAILLKLTRGEIVVRRFTIPEGLTVTQTVDLLASQGLVDKGKLRGLTGDPQRVSVYLPAESKVEEPFEGYLFPATYEYTGELTEERLVALLLERFDQLWTAARRTRAEELGLSIHQVVTLASIIEEEAQAPPERPIIAGVYHNRLKIGMKLDADPTVRYGLKKPIDQPLLYADLDIMTPYNTYRQPGLPPGPISAPGEAAIEAALYPTAHDFWYFVAKADGSGEHYFAKSLEEQNANIVRAEANAARR
jgi:UPF0755 protein